MRTSFAALLCLSASTWAYQVTFPTSTQGWTNSGPQTLTWNRVDTDPLNFTVLLTNQNTAILPTRQESLAALVDGTKGTLAVNPPSSGWPLGGGFQINLVQDDNDPNTIYAQSNQFNITAATSTSASATQTGGTVSIAPSNAPTPSNAAPGTSTSSSALNPSQTSSAVLKSVGPQISVLGALIVFSFMLV